MELMKQNNDDENFSKGAEQVNTNVSDANTVNSVVKIDEEKNECQSAEYPISDLSYGSSSDTSALMKLAELACKSSDEVSFSEINDNEELTTIFRKEPLLEKDDNTNENNELTHISRDSVITSTVYGICKENDDNKPMDIDYGAGNNSKYCDSNNSEENNSTTINSEDTSHSINASDSYDECSKTKDTVKLIELNNEIADSTKEAAIDSILDKELSPIDRTGEESEHVCNKDLLAVENENNLENTIDDCISNTDGKCTANNSFEKENIDASTTLAEPLVDTTNEETEPICNQDSLAVENENNLENTIDDCISNNDGKCTANNSFEKENIDASATLAEPLVDTTNEETEPVCSQDSLAVENENNLENTIDDSISNIDGKCNADNLFEKENIDASATLAETLVDATNDTHSSPAVLGNTANSENMVRERVKESEYNKPDLKSALSEKTPDTDQIFHETCERFPISIGNEIERTTAVINDKVDIPKYDIEVPSSDKADDKDNKAIHVKNSEVSEILHESNDHQNEKVPFNKNNDTNEVNEVELASPAETKRNVKTELHVEPNHDASCSQIDTANDITVLRSLKVSHNESQPANFEIKQYKATKETMDAIEAIKIDKVETHYSSSDDENKLVIDEDRSADSNKGNSLGKRTNKLKKNTLKFRFKKVHSNANTDTKMEIESNVQELPPSMAPPIQDVQKNNFDVVDLDSNSIKGKETESNTTIDLMSRNCICSNCSNKWNDNILKMLFEGNESVTVNSRVTYGAIICMNIYVSINYPNFKESALIGLLERADLAKNLGTMKVSALNYWIVALIKNKKIKCCDSFRPLYRNRTGGSNEIYSSSRNENVNRQDVSLPSSPTKIDTEMNVNRQDVSLPSSPTKIDTEMKSSTKFTEETASNNDSNYDCHKLPKTVKALFSGVRITNGSICRQTAYASSIIYDVVCFERNSISLYLHSYYDKLACDVDTFDATLKNNKRSKRDYLLAMEALNIQKLLIMNSKVPDLEKYYKLFVQILYHREHILLIPDGKMMLKYVEFLRREDNRVKIGVRNKNFLSRSWDEEYLCSSPMVQLKSAKSNSVPTVREIITVFCEWRNRSLLKDDVVDSDLRKSLLSIFPENIKLVDCLGLCVRLYANYCELMFEHEESAKVKVFLDLFYLPKSELDCRKKKTVFPFDMSFLPPSHNNSVADVVSYFEDETIIDNFRGIKRSLPESFIDQKIDMTKKLKLDLISCIKAPKVASLLSTYAKLKGQMSYYSNESLKPSVDFKKIDSDSKEIKLMLAKLKSSNVPNEVIPGVLENILKMTSKRKL